MEILLNSETYHEGKAVLGFFVKGHPSEFLTRYVREQLGARLVGFLRETGHWYVIHIEYPPMVAKLVVDEVRQPIHEGLRRIWG